MSFVNHDRSCTASLRSPHCVVLPMGKGFNRAKNKQAELAKKMAIAKKKPEDDVDDKTQKDRELFEKLLTTTKGAIPTEMDTDSEFIAPIKAGQGQKQKIKKPKPPNPAKELSSREKKEEEKVSQRQFFEALVDVETSHALGAIGAAQLVPWVPPYLTDCLVVFADPRTNSGDLRRTLKYLASNLRDKPDKVTQQVVFVTADSAQETRSYVSKKSLFDFQNVILCTVVTLTLFLRAPGNVCRWLQRSKVSTSIRILSDPELKFMTAYDLSGNEMDSRWSVSMLIFNTDGTRPDAVRNVDPSHATQLTLEAMKEYASKK